jgi:dipeptidyl aminopeptidase/acylaminoacyl peptidase
MGAVGALRRRVLCVLGLAGLLSLGLTSVAQAAFPGLNGRIAFDRRLDVDVNAQVFSINPDGSGQADLSNNTAFNDSTPVYSADGKTIAFSRIAGSEAILVMNADGSGKRQLTTPGSSVLQPAFSPDGKKVVFERDAGGERVFVVNIDGTDEHQLLTPPAGSADENATYSPDGTKIAFVRETTSNDRGQLMLVNADGTGTPTVLTNPSSTLGDHDPNFSPDGTKVTFGRSTIESGPPGPRTSDVYVINLDGTGEQNLTNDAAPNESEDPAFSPDGTLIVFSRFIMGANQLFTMRADGSGKQPITPLVDNQRDESPNWQPLANVVSAAQIPPCVPGGTVTVAVGDTTGFKSPPRGVRYRLDFGAEQVALTNGGVTATISIPAGRHELEYWGQNQAGDQERAHHNVVVTVDQTRPSVVILRDQGRATVRRGQFASVTIRATDAGGTLVRNPSRRRLRVSTATLGTKTVRATAVDSCGNSATALLRYRVVRAAVANRRVVRPRFTG